MTVDNFTVVLGVESSDSLVKIEEFIASLGKAAGVSINVQKANAAASQSFAETGAQAGAAAKANAALAQSMAAVGNETEKTTPRQRVQQNQLRALEGQMERFIARHDPLLKARRELTAAEDMYAKAVRRGVDQASDQLIAMDRLTVRLRSAATGGMDHAKSLEYLRTTYDKGYSAQARFADEQQRVIDLFIAGSINARQLESYLEKIAEALDPAAAAMRDAKAALDGLTRQYNPAYAETARYGDKVREAVAILDAANATDRQRAAVLKGVAEAYDPVTRAINEATAAAEKEAAARQTLIDTARAQQAAENAQSHYNDVLGIREPVQGSAAASASVFEDAERDAKALRDARAALDDLTRQYNPAYAETARYGEKMREADAILNAANATDRERAVVLNGVADAYDPVTKAINEATAAAEKEAAARQKLIDTARAQQAAENAQSHYNNVLDVRQPVAGSAAASASVFEEAERDAKALEDLRRQYDKNYAAEARHREEIARAEAITRKANLTDQERAAILAKVEAANKTAAGGVRLQAHEMTNLSYQIQDFAVQVSSGQSPLLALVQQGPQATMAVGGLDRMLKMLTSSTVLTGAAFVAVAAAIGLAVKATIDYNDALRETARVNKLTGGSSGFSNGGLEAQAEASAKAAHISISAARDLQNAYIGTGKIGGEVMTGLVAITKDYAAATKQDTDKAGQELAGMFTSPGKAAEDAAQRWHIFSDAQVQVIKNLERQGRLEEAQQALLTGLRGRVQGAAQDIAWYAKAWESVSKAISDAWTAMGKFGSGEKSLDELKRAMLAEQYTVTQRGTIVRRDPPKPVVTQRGTIIQTATDKYWAAVRSADGDTWDAMSKKSQADFAVLQKQAMDFVRSVDPAILAVQDFKNAEELLNRAVADQAITADQAKQALALYSRQLEQAINPAKAFADQAERDAKLLETAAGKARLYESERQKILAQRGNKPGDKLSDEEDADVRRGVDAQWRAQGRERVRLLNETAKAQKSLNDAQRSQDPKRIAKATEELSIAQERANGANVTGEEESKRLGRAADQVSTQLGIQADNLNLATQQQWLYTMAAGDGEAAMRKARIEAEVLAASQKGLGEVTRRELEAQEELISSGIHLEFAGQIEQEIAANERLAAALGESVAAYRDAEIYNKAVVQALKETPPEYDDAGNATGKFSEAIAANVEVLKKQQAAVDKVDLGKYVQNLQNARNDLDFRASSVGMSDDAKAIAKAQYDTAESLRRQKGEYATLEPAQRAQWDLAVKTAAENAAIEQGIKRQEDAWSQVGQVGENAFSRIGDAITQAMANGQIQAIKWGNVLKAMVASVTTDLVKLASVDLAHLAGLQQSKGGLLDLFSGSSSSAQGQQGQSGGLMSNSNTLSLGSKLLPDSWFSGLKSSIDNWAYNSLGIGSMATSTTTLTTSASGGLASSLGVAPVPGGVSNAAVAGSTTATSGTLTGLTSYLGAAGIGAMAGGILGPMLANGNKTMGGLIGAGTGAAAGALAGTFLFPGVGTLVGALLGGAGGGLGGLLGTQKASVGPLSSGNLGFNTDGSLWERGVFQDNKGDTAVADAALNATQQLMTGVKSLGGTFDQFSVNFSSFSKDGKTFWRINGADGPTVSQSSDTNVALKDLVKWMSEHKLDGTSEVAGQMLRWSDPNIRKAIAASDAADITGLLKDIDFGATFDGVFKRLKAGLSSTTPALDAMRKAADDLGSTVQTQIVDWRDSAVRLGFATAEELNPMLRSAIREMAGLGTATEPLMGIAAAEEQARLNAAALQPALEAVGATAEEQAQLLTDMVTKARNDYQSEVDFLTRQGQTLYASASDPTARLSAADQFRASGLVPNVALPGLDGLIAAFDAVERAASRGDINAMAFSDAIAKANAMLQAGALTADQYGTVIQAVAADMSRALAVRDAGISGRIAVERAIDPKYAASAVDVMALQHVGAAGVAALAQPFQTFIDQAKDGTATADGLRGTWAALQAQMAAGNLTAEQTTGLLSALTDAYTASGTAANDAARAVEEAATALAAAVEKTRQAQSAAGELAARRADLLGDTTDAALKRFDLQAAAELQGATASGVDVATLRGVLASERAQLAFQQAQQSYLTAIDREIQARQDSTTALQNSALKLKQIADGFKAANDNLRLSDKSDLSPLQRLEEVRRQFEQALTDYRAANDNDVKASLAQKIQDLGNSRVDIAAGYYQTTDYSDYRRVLAVFDQLSIANDNTATTAEETIRQNDQIIAQLTQTRRTAEQLGQAQLGSLESLKTAMDGAKATLDAQLAALKGIGGNTTTVDSQSDAIIRAATVEAGRNFTGQFKDGQYGAYALSQYGSYSAGGFANITSGSTIAAMLRLVTGYTGDFADGKFPAWIKSGAVSPMQAEAAREILRRNNIEPTFAAGGLVTGGTPGVDSVRAWLMPGERVLSVPHSAMLERIYGMATMATAGSRPVANDPLPANIIAMPAAPQQSPPELAELVALLRELIALIGAQQLKALMQTGAIGDATVGKLEEVIEQLDELGYSLKVKKAGG